jgi:dihydrofolate reductase
LDGRPSRAESGCGRTDRPTGAILVGNRTFGGDIETAISESRSAAGDKYVNILGASVAAQCLAAGVLDEVLVCVTPVLLGDGIRLFEHPGGKAVHLNQIRVSDTPQVTNLWYRVLTA